jgi:nitric oxide reductase large subunit
MAGVRSGVDPSRRGFFGVFRGVSGPFLRGSVLSAVIVGSFAVLGHFGGELYLQAPPIPGRGHSSGSTAWLGIGLMLFCLKGLTVRKTWRTGGLAFALMGLLSLLPVGLMQTWASVEHGTWYAPSAGSMQTPTMDALRWLRVAGDTIFAVGIRRRGDSSCA